jgi:hypothetical protein
MANRGGAVQRVPGKTQLKSYLAKGLTQGQIAERWEEDSGTRVSRSAIGMAIERFGLKSAKPRPRYEDLLPWTVRQEHQMAYDARMLRLEGRRREGLEISDHWLRALTAWMRLLREQKAVVTYDPDTADGFFWTPREETDDDIVRRPE